MNQGNPPPYPGPGPSAPYPPYPSQPMGPGFYPPGPPGGPYPPPQGGYPYQGYPQYGWQGGPQEPPKTTALSGRIVLSDSHRHIKSRQMLTWCMWWKTKEGMTWAHLPASQPAGRPSVAAVSGTCSPDEPSSPVLPALPPLRTAVPAPPLLIAEIND